MRINMVLYPMFLFREQDVYIVHGEGRYKWSETVSGQPYSLIDKCPSLSSTRKPGVSVFPLIFFVSLDPSLLYSPPGR